MTLQGLGHIDELIAWLDNEQDGAEDAGFVARNATNWHPALVALKTEHKRLEIIEWIAQTGSVQAFLALGDDDKRRWFALAIDESERRKTAEATIAHLETALAITEEDRDRWHQKYTVEAQARQDEVKILGEELADLRALLDEARSHNPEKYRSSSDDSGTHGAEIGDALLPSPSSDWTRVAPSGEGSGQPVVREGWCPHCGATRIEDYSSVCELAAGNPNVAAYAAHWEGRAEKAEGTGRHETPEESNQRRGADAEQQVRISLLMVKKQEEHQAEQQRVIDKMKGEYRHLLVEHHALRQRHADIRALLNPACAEESIEGAIRNLQQALLSEQGNVATLVQRHAEAVEKAYRLGWQQRATLGIARVGETDAWLASEAKKGLDNGR